MFSRLFRRAISPHTPTLIAHGAFAAPYSSRMPCLPAGYGIASSSARYESSEQASAARRDEGEDAGVARADEGQSRWHAMEVEDDELPDAEDVDDFRMEKEDGTNAASVVPRETTRRRRRATESARTPEAIAEHYERRSRKRQAMEAGTAFTAQLDDTVINGLKRSIGVSDLRGVNVCLFNSHEPRFAKRLLAEGVSGISLIEKSPSKEIAMKAFARSLTSDRRVRGYAADIREVIPSPDRLQGWDECRLLWGCDSVPDKPLTLTQRHTSDRDSSREEDVNRKSLPPLVLLCTLARSVDQMHLLTALTRMLIMHHTGAYRKAMFRYGPVQVITFLWPACFALTVADQGFGSVQFRAPALRHKSRLLNRLFEIDYASFHDEHGVSRTGGLQPAMFEPEPVVEKRVAVGGIKGIPGGHLYGVSLRARTSITIGGYSVLGCGTSGEDPDLLVKYAYWLLRTGKLRRTCFARKFLCDWFPLARANIAARLGAETKITELQGDDLDRLFIDSHHAIGVLPEGEVSADAQFVANEYREFASMFRVEGPKVYAD